MSSTQDSAPVARPTEQTPLLPPEDSPEVNETTSSEDEDDNSIGKQQDPPNSWKYAWYAVWIFLAAIIFSIFVKGWIDADDVDVSDSRSTQPLFRQEI